MSDERIRRATRHLDKITDTLFDLRNAIRDMENSVDPDELKGEDKTMYRWLRGWDNDTHDSLIRLDYLRHPVKEEGKVTHNIAKRYQLPSGYYFTTGDWIEVFAPYWKGGKAEWVLTDVSHNGVDYYAEGVNIPLRDLKVRVRGR